MATEPLPSTVLYSTLKSCGISNRDAAATLLDGSASVGGRSVNDLMEAKSQLSRRIVHAAPGGLPLSCFQEFKVSVPKLASRMIAWYSVEHHKGNVQAAAQSLIDTVLASAHERMANALATHGTNEPSYGEAISHIEQYHLAEPADLAALHLMAIAVGGCTADGQLALANVVAYALDELDLEAHTAESAIHPPLCKEEVAPPAAFGIARVRDNVIVTGTKFHPVDENGLVIGLLPREEPAATDVDHDVSLRHARMWVEDGKLFVIDLGSTNGTTVVSPVSGMSTIVAPPKDLRDQMVAQAVELHYGDFICLGATTRYIVLPGIAPDGILQ